MPELPEVETVVRSLRAAVLGAKIVAVLYASARISRPNARGWKHSLSGRIVESISRRGKYIIITFDSGSHLIVHLRMTGRFRLRPLSAKRNKYDRLILQVKGGALNDHARLVLVDTRQFARADFLRSGPVKSHPGIAKLGPEANQITESQLRQILARSHRPIKSLLLDQAALAGLGNIYADEALYASGINSLTPSDLTDRGEIRRLRLAIIHLLAKAIGACGTTFDTFSDLSGKVGGFAPYLSVYSREDLPCKACGTRIRRIVISGRSAHFCPRCQPLRS